VVKLDPYILNFGDATLLAQILEVLSPEDAIQAFIRINECSTRKAIMDALTSQSRELVDKALTDHLMEGVRDSTQEMLGISTIATKRFLQSFGHSAQICSNKECLEGRVFEDYTNFFMPRCLKHSFHLACKPEDHICQVCSPSVTENECTEAALSFTSTGLRCVTRHAD
jgi:hypothetical protein